jgi:hypothetical protein
MLPIRFLAVADDPPQRILAGDLVTVRRRETEYAITAHRILTPNYGALLDLVERGVLLPLDPPTDEGLPAPRPSDATRRPPSIPSRVLPFRLAQERPL